MPDFSNGCKFNLYTFNLVYANVPLINTNSIDYYFWFKLPTHLSNSKLIQIDCISNNTFNIPFGCNKVVKENKLWLKVKYDLFDLNIGQHTYKFSFMNYNTRDVESYYFSYRIQSDNPNKPYIYVHRKD